MRPIWKGSISFGLVSIPIGLYPATQREELKFRLLRASDLSPVNYKRVAETDGKEVPWDQIVKGYEYEKGKYVVLKDEDFARVDLEATQTVDILTFVHLEDVDPLLFYKPYYMEAEKGGDKAYVLLRAALTEAQTARKNVVVDLTQVEFLDSTGLGALIGAHRRAEEGGTSVRLIVSEGPILRLLAITGLIRALAVYHSVGDALGNQARVTVAP